VNAGRVSAVIAAQDSKVALSVRKSAFLDVFHPGAVDRERYLVFRFARRRAGMTTDALSLVDNPGEVLHPHTLREVLKLYPKGLASNSPNSYICEIFGIPRLRIFNVENL